MKTIIIQKKIFNMLILLITKMFMSSQFAEAKDENNIYLDLSNEEITNVAVELTTNCTTKNLLNQIYGNGKHNIPLYIKVVALNKNGKKVPIKKEDILKFSKIQVERWGKDVSLIVKKENKNNMLKSEDLLEISKNIEAILHRLIRVLWEGILENDILLGDEGKENNKITIEKNEILRILRLISSVVYGEILEILWREEISLVDISLGRRVLLSDDESLDEEVLLFDEKYDNNKIYMIKKDVVDLLRKISARICVKILKEIWGEDISLDDIIWEEDVLLNIEKEGNILVSIGKRDVLKILKITRNKIFKEILREREKKDVSLVDEEKENNKITIEKNEILNILKIIPAKIYRERWVEDVLVGDEEKEKNKISIEENRILSDLRLILSQIWVEILKKTWGENFSLDDITWGQGILLDDKMSIEGISLDGDSMVSIDKNSMLGNLRFISARILSEILWKLWGQFVPLDDIIWEEDISLDDEKNENNKISIGKKEMLVFLQIIPDNIMTEILRERWGQEVWLDDEGKEKNKINIEKNEIVKILKIIPDKILGEIWKKDVFLDDESYGEDVLLGDESYGKDVLLGDEKKENDEYSIITSPNEYTKCTGGLKNIKYDNGFYFKSNVSGETVNLGAKFYYQDKEGKHEVSTSDDEKVKINLLSNPLSGVSSEDLFGIKLTGEYYDSILVNSDNYRLFKIFPLVDKFPTLSKTKLLKTRLTNKDTGESSGFLKVKFNDRQIKNGNFVMKIDYFKQTRGGYGESKRSFNKGFLISGLKKANSEYKADKLTVGKNNDRNLSLNDISHQDFGFMTLSDSGTPLHAWEYQHYVPFLLELYGYDLYGNYFVSHVQEKF